MACAPDLSVVKQLGPLLFLLVLLAGRLSAAEDAQIAAVRAADDERTAATITADPARLEALLDDQLHYAHSNGFIDTKASFIESLTSRRVIYAAIDYTQRDFIPVAPGVILMKGRVLLRASMGPQHSSLDLNFLAVWREEGGRWRFLAWQSSRNPPAATKP